MYYYTLLCAYITAIKDKDLDPAPLDFGDEPPKKDKVNKSQTRATERKRETALQKNRRLRKLIRNRFDRFVLLLPGKQIFIETTFTNCFYYYLFCAVYI